MGERTHDLWRLGVLLLGAWLGCACVDPEARYADFNERTSGMRGSDGGTVEPTERFDWSGRYLLALSTVLGPDQPLLFAVDAEVSSDLSTIDLGFQSLTTSQDSQPRTPIGDPFRVDYLPYPEDGTFSADLGEVTVPGRANPITGSDIVAQVQLLASARMGDDELPQHFCGEVSGMVIRPVPFDLAGSTFGAVLTDDEQNTEPVLRCPQ
jgi:hypothetical protein